MTLENQVCSLEQSKKLKELGVKQFSLFYHFPNPNRKEIKKKYKIPDYNVLYVKNQIGKEWESIAELFIRGGVFTSTYSAFTVSELGVMLPEYYPSWRFKVKNAIKWITTVITKDKVKDGNTINTVNEFDRYAKNEAQARANLLIVLLENNVIKVSDVNKRLISK